MKKEADEKARRKEKRKEEGAIRSKKQEAWGKQWYAGSGCATRSRIGREREIWLSISISEWQSTFAAWVEIRLECGQLALVLVAGSGIEQGIDGHIAIPVAQFSPNTLHQSHSHFSHLLPPHPSLSLSPPSPFSHLPNPFPWHPLALHAIPSSLGPQPYVPLNAHLHCESTRWERQFRRPACSARARRRALSTALRSSPADAPSAPHRHHSLAPLASGHAEKH